MQVPQHSVFTRQDLEAALDASRVGIWVWEVASNRVTWTPQLERLFGFEPGTYDGTFDTYRECIFPDDRGLVLGAIQSTLQTGDDYLVEHRVVRRGDASPIFVECRGRVERAPDGKPTRMTGTVMDVTARHLAEQQLAERDQIDRLLNELGSDYVYAADLRAPVLVPTIVAGSFERVTSYTPEEVGQRGGWFQLVHPDDRKALVERAAQGMGLRPFISEYRIVTRDGDVRWLRDHVRPQADATGRTVRIIGGVKDITDRKHLEEQAQQSQKMEALARLAGGVAHDFNNLLTVIFGGVGVLQLTPRADRDAEAVEAIITSAERAAELTRALLALGRRQLTVARPMKLSEALAAARPLLEKSLNDAVRLEVVDEAADTTVRIDAGQLQLVLLNLVMNARDASPPGGTVKLVARAVELTPRGSVRPPELPAGRYGAVEIIDQGEGIPPQVLPRIFEPFFTTKPQGQGTGLGLAISHGIVSQLGGALAVKSRVGHGTTFTVYLPQSAASSSLPAPAEPMRMHPGGSEAILVVEDEPRLRRLVARVLKDFGYSVTEAGSAEEALALGEELHARLALLLTDVRMPGMDGHTLGRALRERHPGLKVLLMSGYAPDESVTHDVTSGAVPFLSKPFTPDGLARRVRELLDTPAQSTQK
ncbi:MAG: PAS domain-containing protein [Myxococcales bacterium]|nr:PAS domain-containing protein [Myxococcales bacterium]